MKHNTVEFEKKVGNERINQFHRSKNKLSLNNYMKMMDE